MNTLLSSTFSLGVTILQRTALVAMCGLAGWRLWTSMKSKPTLVVSNDPTTSTALLFPSPSHMPSSDAHDNGLKRHKKKKSVQIDEVKNTLHMYTPVRAKFVSFHWKKKWLVYSHEFDPAGYDTLHCRKTKYIRDIPDLDLVDDDGDIGMDEN
ncbi:MAG: hypothetical protein Q9209_000721 [Squamulea sp. 1 TL-2023]